VKTLVVNICIGLIFGYAVAVVALTLVSAWQFTTHTTP